MFESIAQEIRKYVGPFLSVALIVTAVFAVFLSESFPRYEVPVRVLVIVKDSSFVPARDIAANLVGFSGTESYRRLLRSRLLETYGEDAVDFPVFVKLEPEGSLLTVSVRAEDADRSEAVAREAARSLFLFSSRYYNVEKEADFRIVGTVDGNGVSGISMYVSTSLAAGVTFSTFLFLVVFLFRRLAVSVPRVKGRIPVIDARIFRPERPIPSILEESLSEQVDDVSRETSGIEGVSESAISAAEEVAESDIIRNAVSVTEAGPVKEEESSHVITSERKGSAPMNLPSLSEAEARFFDEFSFEDGVPEGREDVTEEIGVTEEISDEILEPTVSEMAFSTVSREPTTEEYRRRLNELLGR